MATVPVRYTTDEFDRCGSGPNLSAYEIWIVRPIGRFKPRHLLDVPKQFEVVEQKSLHYYQWIKQQEAKAYNSHARACRWSTWAIVMVDNKRFKFLKRIYRAGVKIEDGPELTLYANDRSGGDVEAKWHLSRMALRVGA
jgi:hypothetical protein